MASGNTAPVAQNPQEKPTIKVSPDDVIARALGTAIFTVNPKIREFKWKDGSGSSMTLAKVAIPVLVDGKDSGLFIRASMVLTKQGKGSTIQCKISKDGGRFSQDNVLDTSNGTMGDALNRYLKGINSAFMPYWALHKPTKEQMAVAAVAETGMSVDLAEMGIE